MPDLSRPVTRPADLPCPVPARTGERIGHQPAQATRADRRVFLFLQGPHGPFFARLGGLLAAAGATVWRAGFNAGDEFFWPDRASYLPYRGSPDAWPAHLDRLLTEKRITDIVLYGDVRPVHAAARDAASRLGLTLHIFEEGYLRPYWITYERGGSNGHSPLVTIPTEVMAAVLRGRDADVRRPPAHWGDMRQHKFYGALYHFLVMTANRRYPGYASHRDLSVGAEFRLSLRRLLLTPAYAVRRRVEGLRVRRSGHPFVLVLMQLEHDSNFLAHSPYRHMADFVDEVLTQFAATAPPHHRIVFKAHPLEDGRARLDRAVRVRARSLGIADRVHLVHGGKLAPLLNEARSVITINSTAAQQALWRGLPVKAMGRAVYARPGIVSDQSLPDFLRDPQPPQPAVYQDFRAYLLHTSQVPGGFYAAASRAHALRLVVDMMLSPEDPYRQLHRGRAAFRQQMRQDRG